MKEKSITNKMYLIIFPMLPAHYCCSLLLRNITDTNLMITGIHPKKTILSLAHVSELLILKVKL